MSSNEKLICERYYERGGIILKMENIKNDTQTGTELKQS